MSYSTNKSNSEELFYFTFYYVINHTCLKNLVKKFQTYNFGIFGILSDIICITKGKESRFSQVFQGKTARNENVDRKNFQLNRYFTMHNLETVLKFFSHICNV